jgi:hypothetical protein
VSGRLIEYKASPTLSRFHRSNAFVRGIRGPVGAGKSTGCCWELFRRGREQEPGPLGIRRTRFAVVRNTYRELADTTVKTWLDWFPEDEVGKFDWQEMTHPVTVEDAEIEVMFRALDRPDDVKKVLSLELTGAWINEAREVPKAVVDALGDRLGRFPAVKDGGCTWRGMLLDTNSPDVDHWWYRLAEEDRPEGWDFFAQPPGVIEVNGKWVTNPEAENLANLEAGYYETRAAGKKRDHCLIYYANRYGFVSDGKPVYPEFVDNVHVSAEELEPIPGSTLYVGLDFGLTPAAVFAQRTVMGQWRWIDELVTENMGAVRFAGELGLMLRGQYRDFKVEIWGDPAGDTRSQTDEETPFLVLRGRGIPAYPAPTNDPTIRREAVASALTRMIDGKPGLVISPKCKVTRKGMAGGYAYRRVQVAGDERFHDKPDKNKFSHPCEAGQYLMVGAGEGDALIGSTADFTKPLDYSRMQLAIADTQAGIDAALRKRDLADAFEKVAFNDRR